MSNKSNKSGRLIIAGLVLLLMILHQDNWNWDSRSLIFGFIPLTLFYHVCISIGAVVTWYLATLLAWPNELEEASKPILTDDSSAEGGQA